MNPRRETLAIDAALDAALVHLRAALESIGHAIKTGGRDAQDDLIDAADFARQAEFKVKAASRVADLRGGPEERGDGANTPRLSFAPKNGRERRVS